MSEEFRFRQFFEDGRINIVHRRILYALFETGLRTAHGAL